MGISNTTYIKCDAVIKGKPCPKKFALPDPPEKNTPGVEDTVSLTIAASNMTYYFCTMAHLLRFVMDEIQSERPESNAWKATEELESLPQTPPIDNFNLEESN